jgi:hypothetical protein
MKIFPFFHENGKISIASFSDVANAPEVITTVI